MVGTVMMRIVRRKYSEMIKYPSFDERLEYLRLFGRVGEDTFGARRFLNQYLYQNNTLWKNVRDQVIVRDRGCDLGIPGRDILYKPTVHHMNPVTIDQILGNDPRILDPEFLILTSPETHSFIHYQNRNTIIEYKERKEGDTKLW